MVALLLLLFAADPAQSIRQVLIDQQAAWNRGDIEAFMTGYNESSETVFIGKTVTKGFGGVLANYRKRYPTQEAMGKLEFTVEEVRMLGNGHAVLTGRFHLTRIAAAGGDSSGVFSLVFEKEPSGWKIILDHTS